MCACVSDVCVFICGCVCVCVCVRACLCIEVGSIRMRVCARVYAFTVVYKFSKWELCQTQRFVVGNKCVNIEAAGKRIYSQRCFHIRINITFRTPSASNSLLPSALAYKFKLNNGSIPDIFHSTDFIVYSRMANAESLNVQVRFSYRVGASLNPISLYFSG